MVFSLLFLCFLTPQSRAESDPSISTIVIKPTTKHAPPAPIPVISHGTETIHHGHTSLHTDQKCHIEEVELYAEVCTPTIERDCEDVRVKTRTISTREDCVEVVRTLCTETEEVVDNEVCYYVYNKETQEAEATTVEVQYEKNCVEENQKVCPDQKYGGYGHQGYCKQVQNEICYNVPKLNPAKTTVPVGYPVPERKCENKQVKLPRIKCDEVSEKKCFQLPYTAEETQTLSRCSTRLGHPKCEQTPILLPKQICVIKNHKKKEQGEHHQHEQQHQGQVHHEHGITYTG